ncbi:hypothetical protein KUV56_02470 [Ferrimonas balearica]|uniref:hypothetical protein n=1 Tax=Ferrimonas balearica TaxID=44012 RepID=UPI001C5A12BE|nr:hypothetical protein [Ferrimonas balearica]MBW3138390.1 hypothetical protein [Ferrimonas balearica]
MRRLIATLLLGWTLCLSLIASHALAEALHHHDGSALCAQGQLIDHWLHVLPGTVPTPMASATPVLTLAAINPFRPTPPPILTGNRDPPALPSVLPC